MGRGVKSISKKMHTDLCSLQVWCSPWSAQRRDGSTTTLFHVQSCGSQSKYSHAFSSICFMCKMKGFLSNFCFICSLSCYSNPKQKTQDLGFSDLTSLFYFFFPSPKWCDPTESQEFLGTALWQIYVQF